MYLQYNRIQKIDLKDIPLLGSRKIRASDTIDIRPRVVAFNPAVTSGSPFAFSSRTFK
jgi:hypothetical protein